jgi:hypothetical protein
MGALTLEVVRSRRPEALADAATGIGSAQQAVETQVQAAKSAMTRIGRPLARRRRPGSRATDGE